MKKVYIFSAFCFGIFLLNLFLMKVFSLPEFFTSYLNDLLCMPVVLGVCLFIIRLFSKNNELRIPLFTVMSLAAFYAVYFEIYLPQVKDRYTADPVDALLYFIGALLFYFLQVKSSRNYIEFNDGS